MAKYSDHDDGGANYRETYDEDREVAKVMERARSYAKDRGEAFVVFLGSMFSPGQNLKAFRAHRTVDDAREEARSLSEWPKASIKIKRIKV